MNWDAIGAIGEAVGALALIVVIVQVRHARQEMRRSARLARIQSARDMYLWRASHSDYVSLYQRIAAEKGLKPPPFLQALLDLGATEAEAVRFSNQSMAAWMNFQASIESMDYLSPGVKEELHQNIRNDYGRDPIVSKWYEAMKPSLNPTATRYVASVLTETSVG